MKLLLFFLVLTASSIAYAQSEAPLHDTNSSGSIIVISPNQIFVDIMNDYLTTGYKAIDADEMLTRKKRNIAAIILHGLAQVCIGLGSVFGASNKNEKKQGMMNVAGTVLGVASQLAAHSDKPPQPAQLQDPELAPTTENNDHNAVQKEQMTSKLVDLTNSLIENLKEEQCKSPIERASILALIRSVSGLDHKKQLISIILSSPEYAQHYLTELFSMLQMYAHERKTTFVEMIQEKISDHLNKTINSRTPTHDGHAIQIILSNQAIQSGMIISAQQSQEIPQDLLDYLTYNFMNTLESQLKQAMGIEPSAAVPQIITKMHNALMRLYCGK